MQAFGARLCTLTVVILLLVIPAAASVSIVDLISSSPDFVLLTRILQRSDLIPFLNMARNVTFFAPSDNVLRSIGPVAGITDILRYMVVTDVIVSTNLTDSERVYFSSLRSPSAPEFPLAMKVEWVKAEKDEAQNADGMKLLIGDGAATVTKYDIVADNGIVHVVDSLINIPDEICHTLQHKTENSDISIFADLFNKHPIICHLLSYSFDTATIVAPINGAFDRLNDIELTYLRSPAGKEDRVTFIGSHFMYSSVYRLNDTDGYGKKVPSMSGSPVSIVKGDSNMRINGVQTLEHDIVFQNGVLHKVPQFITSYSSFEFTPRKYIYGLNASLFADELVFHGYDKLLDDTKIEQTIFVPVDSKYGDTPTSLKALKYHISSTFVDNFTTAPQLLTSGLDLDSLGRRPQAIKWHFREDGQILINQESRVLRSPVVIGNTALIAVDKPIPMPPSYRIAIGAIPNAQRSYKLLDKLGIFEDSRLEGTTIFIPSDAAWESLGSAADYIEQYPLLAQKLIYSLILIEPVYSNSFDSKFEEYETLFGTSLAISYDESNNLLTFVSTLTNAKRLIGKDTMDILTESGVVHVLSSVPVPSHININPKDLLDFGHAHDFVRLLTFSGLSREILAPTAEYVILAPEDSVLESANITRDSPDLEYTLSMHILERKSSAAELFSSTQEFEIYKYKHRTKIYPETGSQNIYSLVHESSSGKQSSMTFRILSRGTTRSGAEVIITDSVIPQYIFADDDSDTPKDILERFNINKMLIVVLGAGIIAVIGWYGVFRAFRCGGEFLLPIHEPHFFRRCSNFRPINNFKRVLSKLTCGVIAASRGNIAIVDDSTEGLMVTTDDEALDGEATSEATPFLRRVSNTLGARANHLDPEMLADTDADAEIIELPARSLDGPTGASAESGAASAQALSTASK
ncbi:hypothetical protein V1511DRAFT_489296 [Dipodascopsis uninucleata]